ncbi:hypothetical protein KY360_06130 [Candidatus Woesearchaeota archaeon]|nr:hypothetical protein [Candidatus Woesearchaeota archaeon]
MPAEGPYEIMPYKEIVKLKKDLEELQKKSGEAPSRDLLKSIDALTKNMGAMLTLFKSAAEEMKVEEKAPQAEVNLDPVLERLDEISSKLDDMSGKVEETLTENKTIAEGVVAVSEAMDEKFSGLSDDIASIGGAGKPAPRAVMPPPVMPGGPVPPGAPKPGGIEGTISAGGPAPSRLPKGPGPMPPGGLPPLGPPGAPPGLPPLGPPGAPPGGPGGPPPPGAPPKKKGLFSRK